ncbi:Rv3654c family TadE-like protein [Nocardiopsis sp. NPDC050513]|uniref:Rv3654c family TadE-like protein n=1 Tax=Nocardiopsis sp. NPDC050513 TaxID=3364338 RepID=UPI0037B4EF03
MTVYADSDGGSATVLTVGLCGLLVLAALAVLHPAAVRLDRHRAATAADLAALAAATGAVHGTEDACALGRSTAEANGASLDACAVTGLTVEVETSVRSAVLDRPVTARSRAGPVTDPPHPADTGDRAPRSASTARRWPYPADVWDTDTRASSRTPR